MKHAINPTTPRPPFYMKETTVHGLACLILKRMTLVLLRKESLSSTGGTVAVVSNEVGWRRTCDVG